MKDKLQEAIYGLKDRYALGDLEYKAIELAVEYTEKSIEELIDLIHDFTRPQSNKSWTIPRCEKFCRDFGLSMEVQAFLEELCLWLLYGLPDYHSNMKYNATNILREIKKYRPKK